MATVREQREAFLRSRGITLRGFNRSVKALVDKECQAADVKLIKKRKTRRAQAAWKKRNRF